MGRPLEFSRCDAVTKAREVFHRKGYEATSIDDLTAALGISRASLYNTFGDKHGLLIETIQAAHQQADEARYDWCEKKCAPKKLLRGYFEQLASGENLGCYMLTLGAELSTSDPDVQERVQVALDASRKMFADVLGRDPELTPKQVEAKAASMLGLMVSVLTLKRVHPDGALLKQVIEQGLKVLD